MSYHLWKEGPLQLSPPKTVLDQSEFNLTCTVIKGFLALNSNIIWPAYPSQTNQIFPKRVVMQLLLAMLKVSECGILKFGKSVSKVNLSLALF